MNNQKHHLFWEKDVESYFKRLEKLLKMADFDGVLKKNNQDLMNFTFKEAQSCMNTYPSGFPEHGYPNLLFYLVVFFGKPMHLDHRDELVDGDVDRQDSEGPHDAIIDVGYLPHDQWSIDWMIDDALHGMDQRMSVQNEHVVLTLFSSLWGEQDNKLILVDLDKLGEYWKRCLKKHKE